MNVLILLHSDGYIEAFSEEGVNVMLLNVPHMESDEGQILAEELIRISIPDRYREIYSATCLKATENLRVIRPSDIEYVARMKQTYRELDAIGGLKSAVVVAID